MDDRNNTIAGWVLFAGICALGLTIGSQMLFASHAPEKPGYPIEDAEAGAGGESAVPLPNLLAAADPRSEERRVGKSVSVRVDLGGSRIIKKKTDIMDVTQVSEFIERYNDDIVTTI